MKWIFVNLFFQITEIFFRNLDKIRNVCLEVGKLGKWLGKMGVLTRVRHLSVFGAVRACQITNCVARTAPATKNKRKTRKIQKSLTAHTAKTGNTKILNPSEKQLLFEKKFQAENRRRDWLRDWRWRSEAVLYHRTGTVPYHPQAIGRRLFSRCKFFLTFACQK